MQLNAPASTADLNALERQLGAPLPADLRLVLSRFNGGTLPNGQLLTAGIGPGTIEAAVRAFAGAVEADFLDPELLLPFFRTHEDSLLCFDRSAAPISDTWPIVDYYDDTGDTRLVYRTFDGWCRHCILDWNAPDFLDEFTLDKYLNQGLRHVEIEPDVATAHATVAHALTRAGRPEEALASYLRAARCVPPLAWCDWEALKIAALLEDEARSLEAAGRLCSRAPSEKWEERETTPATVADVLGWCAIRSEDRSPWVRFLDQLHEQAWDDEERDHVHAVRKAVTTGDALPETIPPRDEPVLPAQDDVEAWWTEARQSYHQGLLRDEDLLLDPILRPLRQQKDVKELLHIRRDF